MYRLTIERTVFGRMTTQLQKADHAVLKQQLSECKKSLTPKKDTVLWDVQQPLLEGVVALLEHELGFIRKPEAPAAERIRGVIARAKKILEAMKV